MPGPLPLPSRHPASLCCLHASPPSPLALLSCALPPSILPVACQHGVYPAACGASFQGTCSSLELPAHPARPPGGAATLNPASRCTPLHLPLPLPPPPCMPPCCARLAGCQTPLEPKPACICHPRTVPTSSARALAPTASQRALRVRLLYPLISPPFHVLPCENLIVGNRQESERWAAAGLVLLQPARWREVRKRAEGSHLRHRKRTHHVRYMQDRLRWRCVRVER